MRPDRSSFSRRELGGARIVCFATQGTAHREETRIQALLAPLRPTTWPFDRTRKVRSAFRLFNRARRDRPDLIVMEGTGVAGGIVVMLARLLFGVRYAVSGGDAVGPFIRWWHPSLGWVATTYERLLCRLSAGYIGWTPYLAGRALTFGARRAMTAANWADDGHRRESRDEVRRRLGIPPTALVFGLVGSLEWNPRVRYCQGLELLQAVARLERDDVWVVLVGDGSALDRVRAIARRLSERIVLVGWVPQEDVPDYLAAFDVASLPHSADTIGVWRYTTKLSEYLAAGLPIVTGQGPAAYDLDDGWLWRLPGASPWDERYVIALRDLMLTLDAEEVAMRRARVPLNHPIFDFARQRSRVVNFVQDLLVKD